MSACHINNEKTVLSFIARRDFIIAPHLSEYDRGLILIESTSEEISPREVWLDGFLMNKT